MTGITNEEGQIYQSYRYSVVGGITFGAPQYENEYTYNGESYNPNIKSQYLRARYYCVVTAAFITEDSYLGDISVPLTLNRYNYCLSSYLNYADPSGHMLEMLSKVHDFIQGASASMTKSLLDTVSALWYPSLIFDETLNQGRAGIKRGLDNYDNATESIVMFVLARDVESMTAFYIGRCFGDVLNVLGGWNYICGLVGNNIRNW